MAQIEFHGVSKRYGDVRAVHELSIAVAPGTLTTLLGPSGCGKTTVLRMIAGLDLPDAGRICIAGRDVSGTPAVERNVAMVFQNYALFPHMSVLRNVAYGLLAAGTPRGAAHDKARTALHMVKLDDHDARLPSELSGGQQQRVAIARALVLEPDVLLFDEPLSNLDARLRRTMREEIRELQQRLGLTVLYVTHDQCEAMAVSDQIVVMDKGRVAQAGSPQALYQAPDSEFIAAFMGDCNIVDGEVVGADGPLSRVRIGATELRVPRGGLAPGRVRVAIRPEGVRVTPCDGSGAQAKIRSVTCLGSLLEIRLDTGFGEWLVLALGPRDHGYRAGDGVKVSIDAECVAVLHPGARPPERPAPDTLVRYPSSRGEQA